MERVPGPNITYRFKDVGTAEEDADCPYFTEYYIPQLGKLDDSSRRATDIPADRRGETFVE